MNVEPYVEIIILNWNSYYDTANCVNSIRDINYDNYSITIVDNRSSDNSLKKLQLDFPDINFVELEENRGFSAGNNAGIKKAFSSDPYPEYVLLINSDTTVETDFLTHLVERAESENNAGIVTGKIYVADTSPPEIWCAGGEIDWKTGSGVYYGHTGKDTGEKDHGQYDQPRKVTFASGCLMLINSEVINNVGYLPEEYFFGGEEWDYSTSVIKNGYTIWYDPDAVIYHKVSSSVNKTFDDPWRIYNSERIRLLFLSRHLPKWKWYVWYLIHLGFVSTIGIYKRRDFAREHPELNLREIIMIKIRAELDHIFKQKISKEDLNKVQMAYKNENAIE